MSSKLWGEINFNGRFTNMVVALLNLGNDTQFHHTLYTGYNHLSMLGLKLTNLVKGASGMVIISGVLWCNDFGYIWYKKCVVCLWIFIIECGDVQNSFSISLITFNLLNIHFFNIISWSLTLNPTPPLYPARSLSRKMYHIIKIAPQVDIGIMSAIYCGRLKRLRLL